MLGLESNFEELLTASSAAVVVSESQPVLFAPAHPPTSTPTFEVESELINLADALEYLWDRAEFGLEDEAAEEALAVVAGYSVGCFDIVEGRQQPVGNEILKDAGPLVMPAKVSKPIEGM